MSELNQSPRKSARSSDSATDIGYVRRVKAKYEEELMALPHVVGVGIGLAPNQTSSTSRELALVVNVDGDINRDELPAELDGVPVTFRNTGSFKAIC